MRPGAAAVVLAVLASAAVGRAGEVHRWVDANGVVHFADVPPPNVQTEPRIMPDRPPPTAAQAAPPTSVSSTPGAKPAVAKGPAQVAITDQNEEPLGDSRHGVSGTLKNQGGETARDVFVAVTVTSQGEECLSEEIAVRPSTLKPGDKAEFAADFEHPCFRGPTQVSLRVQWE